MKEATRVLTPRAREDGLIVEELPDEVLVYDVKRHQAHCLNQTAAVVWKRCDGRSTVPEITKSLERELKAPVGEDVVWLALDRLEKNHLLDGPAAVRTGGISRRQAMKLGLAAVVALPLVMSIVSPTAAQTASCVPDQQPCNPNGNDPAGICLVSSDCCSCCCHTNTGNPADAHCTSGGGVAGCLPG